MTDSITVVLTELTPEHASGSMKISKREAAW